MNPFSLDHIFPIKLLRLQSCLLRPVALLTQTVSPSPVRNTRVSGMPQRFLQTSVVIPSGAIQKDHVLVLPSLELSKSIRTVIRARFCAFHRVVRGAHRLGHPFGCLQDRSPYLVKVATTFRSGNTRGFPRHTADSGGMGT
jgi:hypothetical protein